MTTQKGPRQRRYSPSARLAVAAAAFAAGSPMVASCATTTNYNVYCVDQYGNNLPPQDCTDSGLYWNGHTWIHVYYFRTTHYYPVGKPLPQSVLRSKAWTSSRVATSDGAGREGLGLSRTGRAGSTVHVTSGGFGRGSGGGHGEGSGHGS